MEIVVAGRNPGLIMPGLVPGIHVLFAEPKERGWPVKPGHDDGAPACVCYTGSAAEYFTWLSAKLDSIEAMPSSRVSLFFRNAS
jgi:hypothetical protein